MTDIESLTTRVLHVLSTNHRGRLAGIHAKQLAAAVGLDADDHGLRTLRKAISDMRNDGMPVAGKPHTGYFMASSAEELEEFIKFLEGRAMHSLRVVSRLRNVSLPELCGQLLLNQA